MNHVSMDLFVITHVLKMDHYYTRLVLYTRDVRVTFRLVAVADERVQ